MKYFLAFLFVYPATVFSQVFNVGGDAVVVPERFTSISYNNENSIFIRDPEKGTLIHVRVDKKSRAGQHFTVLTKVHSKSGGEFENAECSQGCKALYSQYKYKGRERYKTVYLVESKNSYYQIESDSISSEEGRDMTTAIFNQMKKKDILFVD